jgi:hypothetical protein
MLLALTIGYASAQDVLINEILCFPDGASPEPDEDHEWVEIYNTGTGFVDLSGWVLSNRDGTPVANLPAWWLPDSCYLVVHFTTGTNDSDFTNGEGDYYAGSADVFSELMDECGLYTGTPGSGTIIDFLSWAGGGVYVGGVAESYAVTAAIWEMGEYYDTLDPPGAEMTYPMLTGEALGRDSLSTDTNRPEDWNTLGGSHAAGNSGGAKNVHNLFKPPWGTLPAKSHKKWTIMFYFDGANNVNGQFQRIVGETLESVGSDSDINLVAKFLSGRPGDAYTVYIENYPGKPVESPERVKEPLPESPGDTLPLSSFVFWAMGNYPADNYALVLAGHGRGWKGLFMEGAQNRLTMPELRSCFYTAPDTIDVVIFYSCLMGTIEVADQLAGYSSTSAMRYMVASEEKSKAAFPFYRLLQDFKTNVNAWTPRDFAVAAADSFYAGMGQVNFIDRTTSVVDIEQVDTVLEPRVDDLAEALTTALEDYQVHRDSTDNVQLKIKNVLYSMESYTEYNYIDLYEFTAEIVDPANAFPPACTVQARQVMNALTVGNGVVIRNNRDIFGHRDAHGLTIYFPRYQTKVFRNLFHTDYGHAAYDSLFACIRCAAPPVINKYASDPDDCNPSHWQTCNPDPNAPNHPYPPTLPFPFAQLDDWDEFLHRYYEPVADAGADTVRAKVGEAITFDGSGSSDADGSVVLWCWDFDPKKDIPPAFDCWPQQDDWDKDCEDEPNDDCEKSGRIVTHSWDTPGTYPVVLTVMDEHDQQPGHWEHFETDQDSLVVIIEEAPEAKPGTKKKFKRQVSPHYQFALLPNYPNPSNPSSVTFAYTLSSAGHVLLTLYDVRGQHLETLVDSEKPAGYHQAVWSGTTKTGEKAGSGVYFSLLQFRDSKTGESRQMSRKLVIVK